MFDLLYSRDYFLGTLTNGTNFSLKTFKYLNMHIFFHLKDSPPKLFASASGILATCVEIP